MKYINLTKFLIYDMRYRVVSLFVAMCMLPLLLMAQPNTYWQQEVKYKMDIDFNTKDHQFSGIQQLVYYNNSPDTITKVYYHLYFNAFQPGSMMDERSRALPDPDKRVGDRIFNLKPDQYGYQRIKRLSQYDKELVFLVDQTVLRAELATPVNPGDSTVLNLVFEGQVPIQIRRSGRNNAEGIDYTMTQWYPKLAAYDQEGWHPDFYVAREFFADFGSFEVNIVTDADQVIAATGLLVNEDEIWQEEGEKDGNVYWKLKATDSKRRAWKFRAEQVHDFAWASDPEYLRIREQVSEDLELNHYFLKKYQKTWSRLPKYTAQFFELMNKHFGKYPYPQFSVIQGGDGGMEYPMCTMLKGTGNIKGLVGTTVHESAHNWYYAVLASNESRYPWMDEGFTTFAEEEILKLMSGDTSVNAHIQAYTNYLFLVDQGELEPLSTPADNFSRNRTYSISAYSRGSLFLSQLRYIIGEEDFNKGMLLYYNTWKLKHPDPWDLIKVMENVSDLELDWFIEHWVYTTKTIDYGIRDVLPEGTSSTKLVIEKIGEMPMPLEVRFSLKNGTQRTYFIPVSSMFGTKNSKEVKTALKSWPWTHPRYELDVPLNIQDILAVEIDPHRFMCDIDISNNSWPKEKEVDEGSSGTR